MEQEKPSSDTAAVLQEELIQATARERELQTQLDKMKDDVSELQTQVEQQSKLQNEFDSLKHDSDSLKKQFDDYEQRSAPLWEQEMKQRHRTFSLGHFVFRLNVRFTLKLASKPTCN